VLLEALSFKGCGDDHHIYSGGGMSFDALAWAAKQRTGSSGTKLVLMGLAECASRKDALAFPSLAELADFSDLDRKSIIANLDALEIGGFISDTGGRAGRTRQIKVYRLHLESIPQTEPYQKRNSSDFPRKSTENGTRNQSEPVASEAKASSAKRVWALPPGVPLQVWTDFLKSPKRRKAGMNETAYAAIVKNLRICAEHGFPPGEVLALAVERGWVTVKLEWVQNERQQRTNTLGRHQPADGLSSTARAALQVFGR
jgi:hypothetical protein